VLGVALDFALHKRQLSSDEEFLKLHVSSGVACTVEGLLSILFVLAVLSTHDKETGRYQVTPSLVFGFGVAGSFMIAVS